jgi:hypothetical protein
LKEKLKLRSKGKTRSSRHHAELLGIELGQPDLWLQRGGGCGGHEQEEKEMGANTWEQNCPTRQIEMCGPQINLGAPRIWCGSEVPQAPMEWRWRRRRSLRGRYYFIEPYLVEDGEGTSEEDDDGGGNDDQGGQTTKDIGHKGIN